MLNGARGVAKEALPAVVTVPAGRVVATVQAHPSALPAGQLVQLHVEPAATRVQVAVARCNERRCVSNESTSPETSIIILG